MDKFTKEKRSEIMSKIRSRNTRVESLIFRELRKRKIYFQKHYKNAIGNPDIALPRKKKAVFIDGDFWHGYQFPKLKKRLPKKYWVEKIGNNIKRDRQNRNRLKKEDWKILRVWSHEIINKRPGIDKIIDFLNQKQVKSPSKPSIATVTK
jgi:DNA mismatch endonuclease (patch repair protein)